MGLIRRIAVGKPSFPNPTANLGGIRKGNKMNIGIRKIAGITAVLAVMVICGLSPYNNRYSQGKNSIGYGEGYQVSGKEVLLASVALADQSDDSQREVQVFEQKSNAYAKVIADTHKVPKPVTPEAAKVVKKAVAPSVSIAAKKPEVKKVASRSSSEVAKPPVISTSAKPSEKGKDIVASAEKYIGTPYVYGAAGPSSFDCSGLTMFVYNKFGISLPHTAKGQAQAGRYVPKSELIPGDLVFFTTNGTGTISHVGIYSGGGKFIHAPQPGKTVGYGSLTNVYYVGRYITARRLVN